MFTNLHYWFLAESFNLSTLRIPTPVETPTNLKDIDWKDLKIVEEGDNGNNIINLGIQLPGEDKPNEGAVLDIQLVNDELYQPHIFLSDALQGAGLGYKIYLKFIHEFGHIYSGDGRRQNKTQIPAIFDKLKVDGNIEAHRLPHGYLFILKDNPDRNYLVDKYVNKEKKMITTIDEFCSVNESAEPRMMSFTIPEKKNWIEHGENVGIRFMGKTYWIKAVDMKFFEDNIGNTIGFKYFPNAMYIEMPTVLKQNIVAKEKTNESISKPVPGSMRFNQVKDLVKGSVVKVFYLGTYETPDTALKFDAKIVTPPYMDGKDITAVVKAVDSTGEKYLGDGKIWFKHGRWVHAAKWYTKMMNRRSLR